MLRIFKDIHAGETCVNLGNGPSLVDAPRALLERYPSFGANKIFLLAEMPGWAGFTPTYYTIIDALMADDCTRRLRDYSVEAMFIRRGEQVKGAHQINTVVAAGFSKDINAKVVMGGTVTYANLQIAYYMGFTTALLVGVDHSYGKYGKYEPGAAFMAEGHDNAHFHPDYFSDGHIYNAPELTGTERMYRLARQVWQGDDRRIYNLTPDTYLEEFPHDEYQNWM